MKRFFAPAVGACMSAAVATPSMAHFQLAYTPEVNITKPGDLPFKLIFWHPMENGHVMDMEKPEEFYYMHKGKKTDLTDTLQPMTFKGTLNDAKAYETTVPVKRNGDYVFVVTPTPYYEGSENIYIQQITTSYVNKVMPSTWHEPLGLPTEIVPLNKPTNILAGSTFSGILLSDGKPLAGSKIEIEYMAAEPDMVSNKPGPAKAGAMPGGSIVAITDQDGKFTFGIPKAGFWGFAALGSGPAKKHMGKELSQDAVIWVRAYDVK